MTRTLHLGCFLASLGLLAACSSSDGSAGPPAYDASYLDVSADPCSDFYRYACGTWVAQHPPEPGYGAARFYAGNSRENTYFWSLLDDMQGSDPTLAQPRRYYDACLRTRGANTGSAAPLQTLLDIAGSLQSLDDLWHVLAQLHGAGVAAFFSARSEIDGTDPSRYGISLSSSGYSLGRNDYGNDSHAATYRAHIDTLWRLVEAQHGGTSMALDSQTVLDLERAIADASPEDVALRDPVATYNPIGIDDLVTTVPALSWTSYFNERGIADTSRISLVDPGYFAQLGDLLAAAPLEGIRQYLRWRVLETHAASANRALIDEEFAFHEGILLGRTDQGPDEYACLNATREQFGFQLAHHYVTRFVSPTLKPSAEALVGAIRTAMQHNFESVAWLDDETRARAGAKLDSLLNKVGYPDRWPPDPNLALAGASDFLSLRLWLIRGAHADDANRTGMAVDRSDFFLSPDIANAAYRPESNDITIALPILQTPFYGEARPAAFDYGGLGQVVGHELTHAFDDQGRHFDGNGALSDWWSESAAAEFEQRAQCLVDQYDAYEPVPGVHVNGALTLGENIADLGGMRLAFAAFEALPEHRGAGPYSAEQAFFLAQAQVHCSSDSPELQTQLLHSDPHSPDALRVNGVVRNMPEFAQAFSCSAGAPLAPENRCQVW